MKRIIGTMLILWIVSSCTLKGDFPTVVTSQKTDKSVRVMGTRVFIQPLKGFEYIKQSATYKKEGKALLRITEANTYGFSEMKGRLTKQSLEAKGTKVDVLKGVKFNQFDAVYAEGPADPQDIETTITLFFGDDHFMVVILGSFKTGDLEAKDELQKMIKSVYYDDKLQIDPFELANFEFDHSITNFKYAMTASNFYRYTENGKKDAENETANSFTIGTSGKMTDEAAYNAMNSLISTYETSIEFDNKTITRTTINGYQCFVLESKVTVQYKEGIMYAVYMLRNDKTLAFMGRAFNDTDNYLNKFQKTVQSVIDK